MIGIASEPVKVKVTKECHLPKNFKGLKGFLGLMGYYRRFVKNYEMIARPLTQMLKIDDLQWHGEDLKSFELLKEKVSDLPLFAMPNFQLPFEIETNAFGYSL